MPSAKDVALKILKMVDSPEKAIALTGPERDQYLNALNTMFGAREKRAADMGFDLSKPQYHGSGVDIQEFIPSERGTFGPGVYTTNSKREAGRYASKAPEGGSVYALATPNAKQYFDESKDIRQIPAFKNLSPVEQYDVRYSHDARAKFLNDQGYAGVNQTTGRDKYRNTFDPKDIRSVNAAFDPRFKDSGLISSFNDQAASGYANNRALVGKILDYAGAPQRYVLNKAAQALGAGGDPENSEKSSQAIVEQLANKLGVPETSTTGNAAKALGVAGLEVFADPMNIVPFGKIAEQGAKLTHLNQLPDAIQRSGLYQKAGETMSTITKDAADKLLENQFISKETYDKVAQHFAFGGVTGSVDQTPPDYVVDPVVAQDQKTPEDLYNEAVQKNIQHQYNMFPNSFKTPRDEERAKAQASREVLNQMASEKKQKEQSLQILNQPGMSPEVRQLHYQHDLANAQSENEKRQAAGLQPLDLPNPPQGATPAAPMALPGQATSGGGAAPATAPTPDPGQQMMQNLGKNYDDAFNMMAKGAMASASAGAKAAAAEAAYRETEAKQKADMQKQAEDDEAFKQVSLQTEQNKLDQLNEEFRNKASIDPERFWKDKSSLQKIGMAIGIALSGVNGRGNAGMEIINNAINRDIDAQKADIEKARTGVQLENNVYEQMLRRYHDQRSAEAATRVIQYSLMESKLAAVQAKYRGPMAQAQGLSLQANIALEKAKYKQQWAQSILSSPAFTQASDTRSKINALPPDDRAAAKKEWDQYNKMQEQTSTAMSQYDDLYNYRGSRLVPGTDGYSKYDALHTSFNTSIKEIFGRTAEFELEVIKGWLPRLNDSPDTRDYKKRLIREEIKKHMDSSLSTLRDYSILPKQIDFAPTGGR